MTQKRKSRTIAAHQEGIQLLIKAQGSKQNYETGKPWTYNDIYLESGVGERTVRNFFKGTPIRLKNALLIAKALDLKIEDIVDTNEYERLTAAKPTQTSKDKINWREVCRLMLEKHRLRQPATQEDFELDIFVPLGLMKRKEQQRHPANENESKQNKQEETNHNFEDNQYPPANEDITKEEVHQLQKQDEITRKFEHNQFLEYIGLTDKSAESTKNIAIIGEPGAGKSTLLEKIAHEIIQKNKGLPICISLANLEEICLVNQNRLTIEEYLQQKWLKNALSIIHDLSPQAVNPEWNVPDNLQKALAEEFANNQGGGVWLLLDGLDEMKTSSSTEALETIKKQIGSGYLAKARVVLSCRLNVWDANITNPLSQFDTYKTLEFTALQRDKFIQQWFNQKNKSQLEIDLIKKLQETGTERICELVKNPLRLVLLCRIWTLNQGELPETKAKLYQRYLTYFYNWKKNIKDLTQDDEFQEKLHQALGKLAIKGIESGSKFRFTRRLAREAMGKELFKLADELNWLILVHQNMDNEPVYAFFHANFQEYFAACAIKDWKYFLPCKHKKKPLKGKQYRIFESKWEEVILLWLGRTDKNEADKKSFINKLINFKDGCSPWKSQVIDRGFYDYKAYFLAARGLAEFEHSKPEITEIVVEQIIDYVLYGCLLWSEAHATLMITNHKVAIRCLKKRLRNYDDSDEELICAIAEVLGQIQPGNKDALIALHELLINSSNEYNRREAINTLYKIATDHTTTIEFLIKIIRESSNEYIIGQILGILIKFGKNNNLLINFLTKALKSYSDKFKLNPYELTNFILNNTRKDAYLYSSELISLIKEDNNIDKSRYLYFSYLIRDDSKKIQIESKPKVDELIKIIEDSKNIRDSKTCQAIWNLGKIGKGDKNAIATLTTLGRKNYNDRIIVTIIKNLYEIDPKNELIIETFIELVEQDSLSYIIREFLAFLRNSNIFNTRLIEPLEKILKSTDDTIINHKMISIIWMAAYVLGTIDWKNSLAINKLVNLINNPEYNSSYYISAEYLAKIDPKNETLHNTLIDFIQTSSDVYNREKALNILIEIADDELTERIIEDFQKYLIPEKYEIEFQIKQSIESKGISHSLSHFDLYDKCCINCWHFEQYYELMWFCSNNVSYDRFYKAWNKNKLALWFNMVWQKVLLRLKIRTKL